jgi:hypothetical protein
MIDLEDLLNPPEISGLWICAAREMYERNPGDGIRDGIRNVNLPDPRAPGGAITIAVKQSQDGRSFTFGDENNATHDYTTSGEYIGNNQFSYKLKRKDKKTGKVMTMRGVLTWIDKDTIRTLITSTEGGDLSPEVRDPPPNYIEARLWRRHTPQDKTLG